jgi:hypothetical protein
VPLLRKDLNPAPRLLDPGLALVLYVPYLPLFSSPTKA